MIPFVLLYVTCPDKAVACTIGRELVKERLAACVNVHGGHTAIYHWDGALQEDNEVAMTVKSRPELIGPIMAKLREMHPDQVPCVISLPIQGGNPDFLSWLDRETMRADDDF
jgi:periplasmic divalent cation tolerance protein